MRGTSQRGIRVIYFVSPILVFAAAIFYVSSLESVSVPELGIDLEDKFFHMIAYFVFGWLLLRAMHFGKSKPIPRKLILLAILIGLLYGMSDEIHQYFVPGRVCEFWDWLADALGVVFGCEFYRRFYFLELQLFQFASRKLP